MRYAPPLTWSCLLLVGRLSHLHVLLLVALLFLLAALMFLLSALELWWTSLCCLICHLLSHGFYQLSFSDSVSAIWVTPLCIFSCTTFNSSRIRCVAPVFGSCGACFVWITAHIMVRSSFICLSICILADFPRRLVASYCLLASFLLVDFLLWPASWFLCSPDDSDNQDTWLRRCPGSIHISG